MYATRAMWEGTKVAPSIRATNEDDAYRAHEEMMCHMSALAEARPSVEAITVQTYTIATGDVLAETRVEGDGHVRTTVGYW